MIKIVKALGLALLGVAIPFFFIPLIAGMPFIDALKIALASVGSALSIIAAGFFIIWGISLFEES